MNTKFKIKITFAMVCGTILGLCLALLIGVANAAPKTPKPGSYNPDNFDDPKRLGKSLGNEAERNVLYELQQLSNRTMATTVYGGRWKVMGWRTAENGDRLKTECINVTAMDPQRRMNDGGRSFCMITAESTKDTYLVVGNPGPIAAGKEDASPLTISFINSKGEITNKMYPMWVVNEPQRNYFAYISSDPTIGENFRDQICSAFAMIVRTIDADGRPSTQMAVLRPPICFVKPKKADPAPAPIGD